MSKNDRELELLQTLAETEDFNTRQELLKQLWRLEEDRSNEGREMAGCR